MKKKVLFFVVFCFIINCYSQQIVRTVSSCSIIDRDKNIVDAIEKNKNIEISRYYFTYLEKDGKYNYYANLNSNRNHFIEACNLILPDSDSNFDYKIITKPGDSYFIKEYFDGLKEKNIHLVYDCYSKLIEENLNDTDFTDWKSGCIFTNDKCYLMNVSFTFKNYYSTFSGKIKSLIKNDKDVYKITVANYTYFSYYQKRFLANSQIQEQGKEAVFYLVVDGDYLSFYLSDQKTLIQTYIKTDKQTQTEFENFLQTGTYTQSNITWPRHADGSCDYDGSKKLASVQTSNSAASTNVTKNKTMIVAENLKLRSGEATSTQVLTVMSAGTKVKILELGKAETIDGISSNWVKVEVQKGAKDRDGRTIRAGTVGWCYGGYLK